jgi:hypothetical protein
LTTLDITSMIIGCFHPMKVEEILLHLNQSARSFKDVRTGDVYFVC